MLFKLWITASLAICAALSITAMPSLAAGPLKVNIVNKSGQKAKSIYVMLHGGSSSDGQLPEDVPKRLSQLRSNSFEVENIQGRIYFSYMNPVTFNEPPKSRTRYDKVEITYPGVANLTAVDFFGIPFKMEALNRQGKSVGSLAFKKGTKTIKKELLKIRGAKGALVKTSRGNFARILSPQLSQRSYPSMSRYVRSVAGQKVTISGKFFGSPPASFNYSGEFAADGSITLDGLINGVAGKQVHVNGTTIPSAIYTVDGPYLVDGVVNHVSANDVYAVIYRDLLSGFAWGYMGGRYGNNSAKWFKRAPFAKARKKSQQKKQQFATYNKYASVIYKYSNAYGFAFSDTGPKNVQLGLNKAKTLKITILR